MTQEIKTGDRVRIYLDSSKWKNGGWFQGVVIRIDPYSQHRSFYWVKLDAAAQSILGMDTLSVFNPRNIQRIE